ncbi:MAG: hypothetical protein JSS29_16310 [Proteobacteria bacterium]|nr:hypothetical protein [Pseudomonadota bacterium]
MADESPPSAAPPASASALVLPPVAFHGDGAGAELFDALHASPMLVNLSKEAPGSPIQLFIYHTVRPAHVDAKNFFSGLAAVGTLGLSPVVMSGEHSMHYELLVNGQKVLRREYTANLSRKEYLNNKAADTTHGLGPDGEVWAKTTVDLFLKDLANDPAVRALTGEYQLYFGTAAASTAAVPSQH